MEDSEYVVFLELDKQENPTSSGFHGVIGSGETRSDKGRV